MDFRYTNGSNPDFINLCHSLDAYLNEIGGEEICSQYTPYNTLEDIHDVVLAYDQDVPVGCASFKLYEEETAEVKRVFIKKEYRGKGIAEQLMEILEERAKEKGMCRFVLETGALLAEAMALYSKIGYVEIERYGPYKCMKQSICMQKEL